MSWAAVAGAAVTAVGGYLASRKASKQSGAQKQMEGQIAENLRMSSPIGMDFLKGGQANLKLFNDFYKKLAMGDRSSAMALLAPELRMADEQNAAALGSEIGLAPSAGGSAEMRLAGMDRLKGQREDALIGLKTDAFDKLGALGGDMASIGSGILGQSNSGGLGLLGAIQSRRNSAYDQSRDFGSGMFDIMQLLMSGRGNRAGRSTPGTTSQFKYYNAPNQNARLR